MVVQRNREWGDKQKEVPFLLDFWRTIKTATIIGIALILFIMIGNAVTADSFYKPGLVSYWSFDENNGTTAYDLTGNNNLTINNTPSVWTNSSRNGTSAIQCPNIPAGKTTNISTTYNAVFNYNGNYTQCIWINTQKASTTYYAIAYELGAYNNSNRSALGMLNDAADPDDRNLSMLLGNSTIQGSVMKVGGYELLCAVGYKNGTKQFYHNGSLKGSENYPAFNLSNTQTLNMISFCTAEPYVINGGIYGKIDEAFLLNISLPSTEITKVSNGMLYTYDTYTNPTVPTITQPTSSVVTVNNQRLTINWTASTPDPMLYIASYNISLLNSSDGFVKAINASALNTSTQFNWTVNVSQAGYYKVKVEAKDTKNELNSSTSDAFYIYEAYLNLTAKDNVTGSAVNNFTITPTGASWYNATSLSTTSGFVTLYTYYNYSLVTSIDAGGYALMGYTLNATTPTNTYQYNLSPNNSVYITVFNQLTNTLLNTNTTNITVRSETYYTTNMTINGTKIYTGLPSGNYTISFIASTFANTSYDIVVYDRSTQSITARLLPSTSATNIGVYTKSEVYQAIPSATITIQRQYAPGTWATIEVVTTDVNGFSYIDVQEGEILRFIVSADGYTTKQQDMALYAALSPYTFQLTSTTAGLYTNYWEGVNYYYTPNNTALNQTSVTFSITTYNSSLDIAWTAVNANGNIVNVTSSPSGGTASYTANLTNYTGVYPVTYSFYFYNANLSKYYVFTIPVNYYVNSLNTTQTNIKDVYNNAKNDIGDIVWTTILAMFITLTVIITLIQISGNPMLGTLGGVAAVAFFAIVGWIQPLFGYITGGLILLTLVFNRGGY